MSVFDSEAEQAALQFAHIYVLKETIITQLLNQFKKIRLADLKIYPSFRTSLRLV